MLLEKTLRQCCISKKYFPRNILSRLIRIKTGEIFFEKNIENSQRKGRSLHFSPDETIIKKLFHPKKKKMVEHFLRISLSQEQWDDLCNKALNSLKKLI